MNGQRLASRKMPCELKEVVRFLTPFIIIAPIPLARFGRPCTGGDARSQLDADGSGRGRNLQPHLGRLGGVLPVGAISVGRHGAHQLPAILAARRSISYVGDCDLVLVCAPAAERITTNAPAAGRSQVRGGGTSARSQSAPGCMGAGVLPDSRLAHGGRSLTERNGLAARHLRILPGGGRRVDARPAGPGKRAQPVRWQRLVSEGGQLAGSSPSRRRGKSTTEKRTQIEPETEKAVMKSIQKHPPGFEKKVLD